MIKEIVDNIAAILHLVAGLDEFEERMCAYYCLDTWCINQINPFPLLCVLGPNGTGKSQLLNALNHLAYKPHFFTASKMTPPTIRDELGEAHDRTAIIDEADVDSLEELLVLRYLRETAVCRVKVQKGPGRWVTRTIPIFGPSIVHKRVPFKDPAVDGRSIIINTVSKPDRRYIRASQLDEATITELQRAQEMASAALKLPPYPKIPKGIAPRIADSYKPIIALTSIEQDTAFIETIWERLRITTLDFADGQSYEPGPIVVQALLSCLTDNEQIKLRNVRLEGDLVRKIQYDFGHNLNSRQVAKILRNYGFTLRRIGGPYSVIPNLNTLVKVAKIIGIEDEALNKAAAGLIDPWHLEQNTYR